MSGASLPVVMAPAVPSAPSGVEPKAWVAFCGEAELWWLRLLRPGFRHCFVVLNDGTHWITIDPLSPHMEVVVQPVASGFDLIGWLRERGHAVAAAPIRRDHLRPAPLAPFTCVEAAKRVLGLHDRRVVTPWQLYRRLTDPDGLGLRRSKTLSNPIACA
jgi:hypothetical protein